jgi:hypothetical protein
LACPLPFRQLPRQASPPSDQQVRTFPVQYLPATLCSLYVALLANELLYNDIVSPALPSDQWIREVTLWFQTGLAMFQEHLMVFLNISKFNITSGAFQIYPVESMDQAGKDEAQWQCTSQKIRSNGQVQNFNFTALIVTIVLSFCIIITSLLIEPCAKLLRSSCRNRAGFLRQYARYTDNTYWILHVAMAATGVGPWRYGNDNVLKGTQVPTVSGPATLWPPVNDDNSLAGFYRAGFAPADPLATNAEEFYDGSE